MNLRTSTVRPVSYTHLEPMRSKGIGTKLFNRIVEEFKIKGCKSIGTDAYATNTKALDYYEKVGFNKRVVQLVRDI